MYEANIIWDQKTRRPIRKHTYKHSLSLSPLSLPLKEKAFLIRLFLARKKFRKAKKFSMLWKFGKIQFKKKERI